MQCPSLSELPPPPPGKSGWPWTEESPQLAESMQDGSPWPRVSIVTPSYNQAEFIEETIRSVLLQGYPDLEYIIIDGKSDDKSINIIKKYEPWLNYWISERDRGQSHAINKGFRRATGEIMAYLNSDDIYCPHALQVAASELAQPNCDVLIGTMDIVNTQAECHAFVGRESPRFGELIHSFPIFSNRRMADFHFIQPPMFWRKLIWQRTGEIDERYHYIMDREWCLRALSCGAEVVINDKVLARFRTHEGSKTTEHKSRFMLERAQMYWRFSRLPGFRLLPCLLDSLLALLRVAQNKCYKKYDELRQDSQSIKALFTLFVARVLRRIRLGMNAFAQLQRAFVTRNQKQPKSY